MSVYFVNGFGRVVPVDDPAIIEQHTRNPRMREATSDEVNAYLDDQARRALASAAGDTVYYQTVRATPDGYGMSRDHLARELAENGVHLSEQFKDQKVGLLYNYPSSITSMRTQVRLVFTMFESDKLPADWPDYLNMADEVLVPSPWCQEVFAAAGVPATVVPLGYNDRVFKPVERKRRASDPYTFLHYDSFNVRKGFMEVFQAFTEEFGKDEPVRLILKSVSEHNPVPIMKSQYPQIQVIRENMSEADLLALLGRSDCFVYPSRGEGFGITPLEAMATGLPAIVPNAHGISTYFSSSYMREVKVGGTCPGLYNRFRGQDVGNMVVVDVADLRKQMRYAFEHKDEMRNLGAAAAGYVTDFTYRKTAKQLASIINRWREADVVKRPDSKFLRVEEV